MWIRPHPVYSLEGALRIAGEPKFKFYKANQETLNECYQWADAVLYVHTTLSIEAILRGIPVINLDIGNCLNPDPLFNFTDFKWVVEKPEFLIPAIHNIDSLSEEEFYERQKKASDYAKQYLFEVTEKSLASFIQ